MAGWWGLTIGGEGEIGSSGCRVHLGEEERRAAAKGRGREEFRRQKTLIPS
jgi:hypothetical protein